LAGKGNKNQEMAGKRPNGRERGQENRSFPALQGYKFLKNRSKRPIGAAGQLKTPKSAPRRAKISLVARKKLTDP